MTFVIRPGPGAHHHDPGRQEDRLRDRVGHEDDRRPGLLPDPQDLRVHPFAGHLVERPERLVHQQDRGLERQRAGDRDALLHAARKLPRVVLAKSPSSTSSSISARSPATRSSAEPHDLERQLDVLLDRPPVEQDRRLEDHPVVAVPAGPLGRLAVDDDLAAGRLGQVADDAQQRRLAAAGRADQRDELARRDRQVDALERRRDRLVAAGEDLVDAGEAGRRAGPGQVAVASCVGTRPAVTSALGGRRRLRRTSRSTSDDAARKNTIPRSAAPTIAAHSFSGPVM